MNTKIFAISVRSSLIYNTSTKHKRHECDTSATRVRHECYKNNKSVARMKKIDLITIRVKTYFHTPIFTIWQVKDYKETNNFITKATFWKLPCFHAKMRLKNAPQKLKFLMTKAISKSQTLDCSCKCPCMLLHSYA